MSEIGVRAAEAIRMMAAENETSVRFELDCLELKTCNLYNYEHRKFDPSAAALSRMAKSGYDVLYILTGKGE